MKVYGLVHQTAATAKRGPATTTAGAATASETATAADPTAAPAKGAGAATKAHASATAANAAATRRGGKYVLIYHFCMYCTNVYEEAMLFTIKKMTPFLYMVKLVKIYIYIDDIHR